MTDKTKVVVVTGAQAESAVKIKTKRGTYGISGNLLSITIACDYPFDISSGVGRFHPGLWVESYGNSTLNGAFRFRTTDKAKAIAKANAGLVVKKAGVTGDPVLSRKLPNGERETYASFELFNSSFKDAKASLTWEPMTKSVQWALTFSWLNRSQREKVVTNLLKASCVPEWIMLQDSTGTVLQQDDITLFYEGVKGIHMAAAEMEAQDTGEFIFDPTEEGKGALDPKWIDLVNNGMKNHTFIGTLTRIVHPDKFWGYVEAYHTDPACQFSIMPKKRVNGVHKPSTTFKPLDVSGYLLPKVGPIQKKAKVLFANKDRFYRHLVRWTGRMLRGRMVVGFEYPGTCQTLGLTQVLAEVAAIDGLAFPEKAAQDLVANNGYRAGLFGILWMAEGIVPNGDIVSCTPGKSKLLNDLNDPEAVEDGEDFDDINDRSIIGRLRRAVRARAKELNKEITRKQQLLDDHGIEGQRQALVPENLIRINNPDKPTQTIIIDLDAIRHAGFGLDGRGFAVTEILGRLVRWAIDPNQDGGSPGKQFTSFSNLVRTNLGIHLKDSEGVVSRFMRGKRTPTVRVHTTDGIGCHEVWMTPATAAYLGIKLDDVLGGTRTPVLFKKRFLVKIATVLPNESPMADGCAYACPACWKQATKGDADGDQLAIDVQDETVWIKVIGLDGRDLWVEMDGPSEVWRRERTKDHYHTKPAGSRAVGDHEGGQ